MNQLISFLVFFLTFGNLVAQTPQLWVEGQANIVDLVNESFESGLGNFTTGSSNTSSWSQSSVYAVNGAHSATSNLITGGGQSNYLELVITVPDDFTASFFFYYTVEITLDGDGFNDLYFGMNINDAPFINEQKSAWWTPKNYFLSSGTHTIRWEVGNTWTSSTDQIQVFLDDIKITYNQNPSVRIQDGTEGLGKVLTSDASGNASWKSFTNIMSEYNNGGNGIIPFILDGTTIDFETDLIRVMNGNNGIRTSNNNENGILSTLNSADGVNSHNNQGHGINSHFNIADGVNSNNNQGHGINSSYNQGHGINSNNNQGNGINSNNNIYGVTSSDNQIGIASSDNNHDGIWAANNSDDGILSSNNGNTGVCITSNGSHGINASYNANHGIYAVYNNLDNNPSYYDGYFGSLYATTASGGIKTFMIDHPLDPENKFLYHSVVESSDMMNVYNGNVILDEQGEAIVKMEDWFEPLNKDFRYQLTAIGAPGPNLYIAEEIQNNQFKIAGGIAGMKVSWQITGIRQDPHANLNRVEVEKVKPGKFKGYYLNPEAHNQPYEKGFEYIYNDHKTPEQIKAAFEAKQTKIAQKHIKNKPKINSTSKDRYPDRN